MNLRLLPLVLTFLAPSASLLAEEHAPQKTPEQLMEDGVSAFFKAKIPESAAAFDALVELAPDALPHLWQRGLTLYYAKRFQDGKKQFEVHQTVNGADVENAAWHFICVCRLEGVEAARKNLIPIEGDQRVPMKEVQNLFAGRGDAEAVLKAASASEDEKERRNHLCYAHLYLGLYYEAVGELEKAKENMVKAATDYRMDHYMGRTAQVHSKLRGWTND